MFAHKNNPGRRNFINASCHAAIVGLFGVVSTTGVQAQGLDTGALPEAEAGECYVKALVPPSYKQETVSQVVKEASEQFSVVAAQFGPDTERLLLKDASTQITVTEPQYKQNEYQITVTEATREYVRGSADSTVIASSGMLFDVESSGINLDTAEAGQCFYEHFKPATVESSVEKALVTEATEKLEVVPASFRDEERDVLVKPASTRYLEFPAVYKTVSVEQLIEPAKTVWQKGTGPVQKIDDTTGEIMCRVELPAVYDTFERQVVDKPARTTLVPIPEVRENYTVSLLDSDAEEKRTPIEATYEEVTKYEVLDDASFSWVAGAPGDAAVLGDHTGNVVCVKETPAVIKTIDQTLVASAGGFESKEVPAVYQDKAVEKLLTAASFTSTPITEISTSFDTRTKITDSHFEWRPVLCETNVTDNLIADLQSALIDKGYDLELTPGVISTETFKAVEVFQEEVNLPQGGLTIATLEALGVER